jgi:hypothetical protein
VEWFESKCRVQASKAVPLFAGILPQRELLSRFVRSGLSRPAAGFARKPEFPFFYFPDGR